MRLNISPTPVGERVSSGANSQTRGNEHVRPCALVAMKAFAIVVGLVEFDLSRLRNSSKILNVDMYASLNSFSQLRVRTPQRKEVLRQWLPRAGRKILM